MNPRYCVHHDHRASSRAWRLILARHSYDGDAQSQVIAEVADCVGCWKAVALAAVDACHSLLIRGFPVPEMDNAGNCTGQSIDWVLARIDDHLGCEAADRRSAGPS